MTIDVTSPAFEEDEYIPSKYACNGDNVNPPLEISGIPDDTESLIIIMEDLDSEALHWLVWNIEPVSTIGVEELPEDSIEGYNDFGTIGYHGPCSEQEHRYQIHVYAIDTVLELDEDVTRDRVEREIAGHILDENVLIGLYQK